MFSSMCCWKNPAKYQPKDKKEEEEEEDKCCKHCPMRKDRNEDNDITVWPQEKKVRRKTPIRGFSFFREKLCSLVSNILNQPIRFL